MESNRKKGRNQSLWKVHTGEKEMGSMSLHFFLTPSTKNKKTAESSPLQYFLSLLFRDLDSQVPERLDNLLGIDAACKDKPVSSRTHITD